MKAGTKTILFGTHQFILHPIFVFVAWLILYRALPRPFQFMAIITHDLGYWGQPNIDGEEGERHPSIAAEWWRKRFGDFGTRVAAEIIGHSRFYARASGQPLSMLFYADKLSIALYPSALYLTLGTLSGEIREYMRECATGKYSHFKGTRKLNWWLTTRSKMTLMALGQMGHNAKDIMESLGECSS